MICPIPEDRGRGVLYTGNRKVTGNDERGFITSMNDSVVFVNYYNGGTSAATDRCDLEWEFPIN